MYGKQKICEIGCKGNYFFSSTQYRYAQKRRKAVQSPQNSKEA